MVKIASATNTAVKRTTATLVVACFAFALIILLVLSAQVGSGPNSARTSAKAPGRNILLADSLPGAMPMPKLGFGTCCRRSSRGQPLVNSTLEYLSRGGRLIDTAQFYRNHRDLAVAIKQSNVPRQEIWITSKVDTRRGGLSRSDVMDQVDTILTELDVAYVDLVLLHHARNNDDDARADQWRGLLDAKGLGKIRHAGVSNYNRRQLEALGSSTGTLPTVNQLEYHPWVDASVHELVRWCQDNNIAVTAYGSLGSGGLRRRSSGGSIDSVAQKYGVSSAAVLLRWALGKGCAVIPGATSAAHIEENLHPAEFDLTEEDERDIRRDEMPDGWRLWKNMVG